MENVDMEQGDKPVETTDTPVQSQEPTEVEVDATESDPVVPEVKTQDPDEDHSERSRLGRRVRRLEDDIRGFMDELRASRTTPKVEDDLPEVINTPDDVLRILDSQKKKEAQEREKYEGGYVRKLAGFRDDPEYKEVEKEMLENYNVRVTGDPSVDAELNWTKAKLAVAERKIPGRSFKGRAERPVGTPTIPTRSTPAAKPMPELSDYAKEFVRRTGMSEASTRSALGVK